MLRIAARIMPLAAMAGAIGRSGRVAARGRTAWSRSSGSGRGTAAIVAAAAIAGSANVMRDAGSSSRCWESQWRCLSVQRSPAREVRDEGNAGFNE